MGESPVTGGVKWHSVTPELIVADDLASSAMHEFERAMPRRIALAGGSTPRSFYERLATLEYPWPEVRILQTDERCVPSDHPDSNLGMIREAFLDRLGWSQPVFHEMDGERCDADVHEGELRQILGEEPHLDLAVLGLGADGHTASLFPGDRALTVRDRWVVAVDRPDHRRLTLTLSVLSSARVAMFLVAGARKREALLHLLEGDDVPASRVTAGRVVVVADAAAAG